MNITTFKLDIAKLAFQMYRVEATTGEIVSLRFTTQQVIESFGRRATGPVAIEAWRVRTDAHAKLN
jgi:hypothetical protein